MNIASIVKQNLSILPILIRIPYIILVILSTQANAYNNISMTDNGFTGESDTQINSIFIGDKNTNIYESITIPEGISETIYPYAKYSNGIIEHLPSGSYIWSSSGQVSIDTSGVITGNVLGKGSIALSYNKFTVHIPVEVTAATIKHLDIIPEGNILLPLGKSIQLNVLATFSDGSSNIISNALWNSEESSVISIDSNGLAKANKIGSTNVNATSSGQIVSKKIETTGAKLQDIQISVESNILISGTNTKSATAIGFYSDNNWNYITSTVSWIYNPLLIRHISANGYITIAPGILESVVTTISAQSISEIQSNTLNITIIPVTMTALEFDIKSGSNQCNRWLSSKVTKCLVMINVHYNDGSYIENFVNFPPDEMRDILSKTNPSPRDIIINNSPLNRNIELIFNSLDIESVEVVIDYNGLIISKSILLE